MPSRPKHIFMRVGSAIPKLNGTILPLSQYRELKVVYDYVLSHTKSSDRLLAFPDLEFFNYLCDRTPVSRFYSSAFAWPKEEWQHELMQALVQDNPPVVLMRNNVSVLACSIGRFKEILPEIQNYVLLHYTRVRTIGDISIFYNESAHESV